MVNLPIALLAYKWRNLADNSRVVLQHLNTVSLVDLAEQGFVAVFLPRTIQPEDGRNRFGVADRTFHNHVYRSWQREHSLANDFILFGLGDSNLQACRQIDRHGLRHEPRAGIELQNPSPATRAISCLLDQLALRRLQFVFARINAPRG